MKRPASSSPTSPPDCGDLKAPPSSPCAQYEAPSAPTKSRGTSASLGRLHHLPPRALFGAAPASPHAVSTALHGLSLARGATAGTRTAGGASCTVDGPRGGKRPRHNWSDDEEDGEEAVSRWGAAAGSPRTAPPPQRSAAALPPPSAVTAAPAARSAAAPRARRTVTFAAVGAADEAAAAAVLAALTAPPPAGRSAPVPVPARLPGARALFAAPPAGDAGWEAADAGGDDDWAAASPDLASPLLAWDAPEQ